MGKFASRVLGVLATAACLAGCGTIDRVNDVVDFADRVTRVNDQRIRVLGDPILGIDQMPATAFEAIPASGSATFLGSAFLNIRNSDSRLDSEGLVGDTRLVVDFGNPDDAVSGGITNIRLTQRDDISDFVPGRISFDNGQIGGDQPNDLAFDYTGDVTYNGVDFALDGRLEGKFRGTRTEPATDESPVRAFSVRDGDIGVTVAEGDYTASMTVIGEN